MRKAFKIRAFTILEMVVTILLSLILFSLLYASRRLIREQLVQSSRDLSDILLVKTCLYLFLEEGQIITCTQNRLCSERPGKTVYLEFRDSCVLLLSGLATDTVYRGACRYRVRTVPGTDLIEETCLEIDHEGRTLFIRSGKEYAPSVLLRRKEVNFEY